MDFKDKVIIVTGSSSGIGATTAVFFAKLSATVVITGRNEEKLKNVAKTVENAKGIKPLVIKADVTKNEDVQKIIDGTVKEFGKIDVLINNAGAGLLARLQDGVEAFDKLMSTNLRSVYLLTSLAAPHLIKTKGNIVNISSIVAVKPMPQFLPYCVSKAGLDMFTKCVAKDLAAHGVRVNSVNPGPVKTNFQAGLDLNEEQVEEYMKVRVDRSPLGYISTTENVADLIIFLASDKARSITGSIYFIDNGELLG